MTAGQTKRILRTLGWLSLAVCIAAFAWFIFSAGASMGGAPSANGDTGPSPVLSFVLGPLGLALLLLSFLIRSPD